MSAARRALRRAQRRDALLYWIGIPAAVTGGGAAADRLLRLPPLPGGPALAAGALALLVLGNALIGRSMRDLRRIGEGTPNPRRPAARLVTEGSYALCRHPMWLGYDLAALGIVLLLRSPGALVGTFPLFLFLQRRFLRREEKILERRFGEEFRRYRERVPFLLPLPRRRRTP